jgi:hypothetical protein
LIDPSPQVSFFLKTSNFKLQNIKKIGHPSPPSFQSQFKLGVNCIEKGTFLLHLFNLKIGGETPGRGFRFISSPSFGPALPPEPLILLHLPFQVGDYDFIIRASTT